MVTTIKTSQVPFIKGMVNGNLTTQEVFGVESNLFELFRLNGYVEVNSEWYSEVLKQQSNLGVNHPDYTDYLSLCLLELYGVYFSFTD